VNSKDPPVAFVSCIFCLPSMTYKRFKTLVELVTVVGDPMDKKRSFKFPLTACEMLSSDSTIVFAKLVPEGGTVK